MQKERQGCRIGLFIWMAICFVSLQQCSSPHDNNGSDSTYVVRIAAMPGLRYDSVRFQVPEGASVKIVLINEDDMDHNMVITRPGRRKKVVQLAQKMGGKGPQLHYIPEGKEVMWKITTVRPGDSQTITFSAPERAGVYPYVCTYPGHGMTMYGAMYVGDKILPPLRQDPNIPSSPEKNTAHSHRQEKGVLHPYTPTPPYLIRTFMPQCGPAAIAVHLTDSLSYCFDAGSCYLRYCWSGPFLIKSDLWQRKGDEVARLAGTLFFNQQDGFPIRMNNEKAIPDVRFKGYSLKTKYPELHYQVGEMDVYETILPLPSEKGIIQQFRIPGADGPVFFYLDPSTGNQIEVSKGTREANGVRLTAIEAREFSVSILKNPKTPL